MIQKKLRKRENATYLIFAASLFFLFLISTLSAVAQESFSASLSSVGAETTLGTPIEEILSAAGSGGLSSSQDLLSLIPDAKKPTPESQSSPDPLPVDPPAPGVTPDSLKDLETQGGLSSDPQVVTDSPTAFNLAVKFFEKVVFKKDVEFASRPKFNDGLDVSGQPIFDKDTAGYAIIKEGNQSVEVDFDHEYSEPPIVTATLSLQQYKDPDVRAVAEDLLLISDVKYIVTNVSKKGFEIMMSLKADSDIPFSWHALAVDNPTTSKKEGESPKDEVDSKSDFNASAQSLSTGNRANSSAAGPAAVGQSETSQAINGSSVGAGNTNPN